ncbi:hypothetical protein Cni_G18130 [Canna indica]|uniref:NADP-dependent oxidoreductase domain-containing protein n=1 Tax=Canna indica TaxID=4628 RepID=A0AAQ3KNU3_9LILI|nr:hypothetical protein Cni_G18130 [Canna indica]
MAAIRIPEVSLSSGSKPMPLIAFGTASLPLVPSESTRKAILHAIRLGYRHFDTAFVYGSEESLGEAVVEALESGLIQSRDELFITSKLWCRDAHGDRVLPALQKTLGKLQMEYLDLYLIHWPVSAKPAEPALPLPTEELLPMDMRSVWEAMEECQRLGLTRSIGVCNFSCKKMDALLSTARIPPAVNQVEVNPLWQQKKTREFCLEKGIQVCGYSPLGGRGTLWGQDWVMECDVLQQIARAKGKTLAQVSLSSGSKPMPLIAFGTASLPLVPSESTRKAILHAIRLGYRHFDTAFVYGSEESLGEAVVEALESGLIQSRDELFITSKLWCRDAHGDRVLPALQKTLGKLQMEYLDLYLIHWPVSTKPAEPALPLPTEELLPMDMRSVWEAMEECQRLGLTRSIGVCNFSCKKMDALLSTARIPPAVNQVEVNPLWQQKKTREFCLEKGIQVCGYSPLGARGTFWGQDWVMECDVLQQIAQAKGKTLAQVCLRWVHEQGDCVIVKSFNEKRMKENLDILDWKLSEEEKDRISQIPQRRGCLGLEFVSAHGPTNPLKSYGMVRSDADLVQRRHR